MPGRACQERKAEKKKAKRELEMAARGGDGGLAKKSKNLDDLIAAAHSQLTTGSAGQATEVDQELRQVFTKALVEAVHEYDRGQGAPVNSLAAFHKVQAARRDPSHVAGQVPPITEILVGHQDIFQVNTGIGGLPVELALAAASGNLDQPAGLGALTADWTVKLIPNSAAIKTMMAGEFTYTPAKGWTSVMQGIEKNMLPATDIEPVNTESAMMAIRAEVIRSLHHRGGFGALNDIGQEPYVKSHKLNFLKAVSLLDILKKFEKNFQFHDQGDGKWTVELISYDTSDSTLLCARGIAQGLKKSNGKGGKGGGKGKGKFGGGMGGGMADGGMAAAMAQLGMGGGDGGWDQSWNQSQGSDDWGSDAGGLLQGLSLEGALELVLGMAAGGGAQGAQSSPAKGGGKGKGGGGAQQKGGAQPAGGNQSLSAVLAKLQQRHGW